MSAAGAGDLVRDLVNLFGFARDAQGNLIIIPSLELVKWKYDPHPRYDPDRIAATGEAPDTRLISFWYFLLPTCIYILFTCLGFCVSFLPVMPGHPTRFSLGGWPSLTDPERLSLLSTISYTFLGGYIWTINYLIKRVSNFDFSPMSFLRASATSSSGLLSPPCCGTASTSSIAGRRSAAGAALA
jgi:hypothetical protein